MKRLSARAAEALAVNALARARFYSFAKAKLSSPLTPSLDRTSSVGFILFDSPYGAGRAREQVDKLLTKCAL